MPQNKLNKLEMHFQVQAAAKFDFSRLINQTVCSGIETVPIGTEKAVYTTLLVLYL